VICISRKDTFSTQKIFLSFISMNFLMNRLLLPAILISFFFSWYSCKLMDKKQFATTDNKQLARLLDNYYESRMRLFPIEATQNGDSRYNNLLPVDFTNSYIAKLRTFYTNYLDSLRLFPRRRLNQNDGISYDIIKRELQMNTQRLRFRENYFPCNQFTGLPLTMGQFGSGESAQPFNTMKDYADWEERATSFSAWTDSAIVYFRKGIAQDYVLPHSIVVKMIPQLQAMATTDLEKSVFYGPVRKIPPGIDSTNAKKIERAYTMLITQRIAPAYKRLADFLQDEYLPRARTTSGVNALADGDAYYRFLVKDQTTTDKSPEEIYQTGLSEVARIRMTMDSVKNAVGFKGDLAAFFQYMKTDKKFMPFATPGQILDAFEKIHRTIEPNLKKMFTHEPRAHFEIRQTEAFRAASASAEYLQGTADGTRPGIFYVPILDAASFNTSTGMESLFLHEAIPGHHYQISLQQEDTLLPKFRRFGGNDAYVEGWAEYCESLGKGLGLYTDPYQYMGELRFEIHRSIRLVVDVALHTKDMTREGAIKYMMDNEAITEQAATAEIERYMVIPGQALSYKIGSLKIRELRSKYELALGDKFSAADFHDEILKDGAMPLEVLEKKMDAWAAAKNR
jgi:uncharacterized protein (DUF885 family)